MLEYAGLFTGVLVVVIIGNVVSELIISEYYAFLESLE
jgi:hypothetical protein